MTYYFLLNLAFTLHGYSTLDVLLKVTEDWKFALDIDDLVGIVFIDLHKAFDSSDHSVLVA